MEMKKIPDKSIDLVLTDPPYGIEYQSNARKQRFEIIENDNNLDFIVPMFYEFYRILKLNSSLYCFVGWNMCEDFIRRR